MPLWYVWVQTLRPDGLGGWLIPTLWSKEAPKCHKQQLYQVVWGRKEYAAFLFLVYIPNIWYMMWADEGGEPLQFMLSDIIPQCLELLGWRFLGYLKQPPSRGVPCE
jgi:hypothetical protein